MSYEYVDAEAPEWPARVSAPSPGALEPDEGGEGIDASAIEAERERAVRRAEEHVASVRRRRARPEPAWAGRPVEDVNFCVIDLETTGLCHGRHDEIIEIGAVQVGSGELGREFSTLVNPLGPISSTARAVHGISDLDVALAPRLAEALPWVLEMARDRVLVFHNAPFDLGFLQRALAESGREPFDQPVLDTLALSRRILGGRCGLGQVGARLGIRAPHPHRALADARLTALVLVDLLALSARGGVGRIGEIAGVSAARRVQRRRRAKHEDVLRQRLESAIRRRELLHVAYHAAAGMAPLELDLWPLRLPGGLHLVAREVHGSGELVLELCRIQLVRSPVRGRI